LLLLLSIPCLTLSHSSNQLKATTPTIPTIMSLAQRSKTFRYAQAKAVKSGPVKLPSLSTPPVFSSGIAASEQWVAAGYGASKGSVVLVPTSGATTASASSYIQSTISAHASDLGNLAWNPFVRNQLATCGVDGTVKLWSVPSEGLSSTLTNPTLKLEGGMESVHSLAFHPSASGVLAAGHKCGLTVFDLEAGSAARSFNVSGYGKDMSSVHWSRAGSLLAGVGKNAALSVFDPRAADEKVLDTATAPNPLVKKLQHALFIGGEGTGCRELLTLFGVNAGQRPCVAWVDPRNTSTALKTHDFDFSQGYSLPLYESDTHTLYYTIRGSEMVQLLDVELVNDAPSIWPSHTFTTQSSVKGLCLLPKRAVDTNGCEVNRVFTLSADSIETCSVTIPRKTAGFHAELFPDTASDQPALTAAEWLKGADKAPLKTSMVAIHESNGGTAAAAGAVSKLSVSGAASSSSASAASPTSAAQVTPVACASTSSSSTTLPARRESTYQPSKARLSIDSRLKKSPYLHCQGKEPPSMFQTYFDIKFGQSIPLAENIVANRRFIAIPWKASGGSAIAIFRQDPSALGRCPPSLPCVRGHKSPASAFDLSPFDQSLLATGSVDGEVFLWHLPEGGLKSDLTTPSASLTTSGKVTHVKFHPTIANLLVVCTTGFDGHAIELFDIRDTKTNQDKAFRIHTGVHEEAIIDIAFHPNSHLVATTAKDGKSRVIHLSSGRVEREFSPPESVKDTRTLWVDSHRLLTVGFAAGGQRSMTMVDVTNEKVETLQTVELDRVPYLLLPRYDPDTRLLYVANAGGTFVPIWQLNPTSGPYIDNLSQQRLDVDVVGFVLLSKHENDVRKVEIQRALKLTKDDIRPISYTVPRKRTEFFQDDLIVPTRKPEAELDVEDFIAGKLDGADGVAPTLVSLQPPDMQPLSSAPEEEATDREKRYASKLAAEAAPKPVGVLGHTSNEEVREHFRSLVGNVGGANRWDAKQDNSRVDVDDSEWD